MKESKLKEHTKDEAELSAVRVWMAENPGWSAGYDAETVVGLYRFYEAANAQGLNRNMIAGLYVHLRTKHRRAAPFSDSEVANGVSEFMGTGRPRTASAGVGEAAVVPEAEANEDSGESATESDEPDDETDGPAAYGISDDSPPAEKKPARLRSARNK